MPAVLSTLSSAAAQATHATATAYATTTRRGMSDALPSVASSVLSYLTRQPAMAVSTLVVGAVFAYALTDRPVQTKDVEERIEEEEKKEVRTPLVGHAHCPSHSQPHPRSPSTLPAALPSALCAA